MHRREWRRLGVLRNDIFQQQLRKMVNGDGIEPRLQVEMMR